MMTEKDIDVIKNKYDYYLTHSYIDIALSQSGKAYFIEFDKNGVENVIHSVLSRNWSNWNN